MKLQLNKIIKDLGTTKDGAKFRRFVSIKCLDCKNTYTIRKDYHALMYKQYCSDCKAINAQTRKRLRNTYKNMIDRCYNKNNIGYDLYGAKGVTVSKEWLSDFELFYKWALENGYSNNLTIDKDTLCKKLNIYPQIYSEKTCIWTDKSTQASAQEIRKDNKSGYIGINERKDVKNRPFVARISYENETTLIGRYDTKLEASKARDNYIIENGLPHTLNHPHT